MRGPRLAVRERGDWIVAYLADMGTMDGAVEVARLSRFAAKDDGGAHADLFQEWKEVLSRWLPRFIERASGLRVIGVTEEKPPPEDKIH